MGQTGISSTKINEGGRTYQNAKIKSSRKNNDLAASATEQIQKQVGKSLEPKIDVLLAKVNVNA